MISGLMYRLYGDGEGSAEKPGFEGGADSEVRLEGQPDVKVGRRRRVESNTIVRSCWQTSATHKKLERCEWISSTLC